MTIEQQTFLEYFHQLQYTVSAPTQSNFNQIVTTTFSNQPRLYTAQKIKRTLKQHNVTPSQSHFCEIKLST